MARRSFETSIGECSVSWSGQGIDGVDLPGPPRQPASPDSIAEPPTNVAGAIAAIQALLGGEARDLRDVTVDLRRSSEFDRRVYEVARGVGTGETITYGEIAAALGDARAAREVGAALGRNPVPIIIPCHRVVAANGATGGFSAPGGVTTKLRMLAIEAPHAPGTLPLFA